MRADYRHLLKANERLRDALGEIEQLATAGATGGLDRAWDRFSSIIEVARSTRLEETQTQHSTNEEER